MKKLSDLLPTILQKYKITEKANAAHILYKTKMFLVNKLGKNFEKDIHPFKYKNNKLYIYVSSSVMAQEINLYTIDLIDYLDSKGFKVVSVKILQSR